MGRFRLIRRRLVRAPFPEARAGSTSPALRRSMSRAQAPMKGFVPDHREAPARRSAAPRLIAPLALILVLSARVVAAQQIAGFAEDRFEPAAAGSSWMYGESLDFAGHLQPGFVAVADWAWKPLVFYDPAGHEIGALVRQQAVLNVDAAITLWERARVDLDLPLVAVNSGSDVQIQDQSYSAPRDLGIGDLRLGADVRLLGRSRDGIALAAGARLFVPTGSRRSFTGDDRVRFWPRLMLAGERDRFVWSAQLGMHLRPHDSCTCDLTLGNEVTFAAGAGWRMSDRALARVELYGSDALSSSGPFARASVPIELLASGRVLVVPHWLVDFGVAPGLANGPGSPTVRVLLGLEYAWDAAPALLPTSMDGSDTSGPVANERR